MMEDAFEGTSMVLVVRHLRHASPPPRCVCSQHGVEPAVVEHTLTAAHLLPARMCCFVNPGVRTGVGSVDWCPCTYTQFAMHSILPVKRALTLMNPSGARCVRYSQISPLRNPAVACGERVIEWVDETARTVCVDV